MSRKLRRAYEIVWQHGHIIGETSHTTRWRYRPRSNPAPGKPHAWGVFDVLDGRFVANADLVKIKPDVLADEILPTTH